MRAGSKRSPEDRAAIRARMRDPEMRRKISERTKQALANNPTFNPELKALRTAWRSAAPATRKRFLSEVFAAVCEGQPA